MKYFILLVILAIATVSRAANISWEVPGFTYSFTRPANAGSNCSYGWDGSGGIVNGPAATFSSGGPGAGPRTGTRPTVTLSTADTVTSVRLIIYLNITNGSPIPVWWEQARKVGDTTPPKGGPFNGPDPITPGGDPVDNSGDPVREPPKRYKARASTSNPYNFPVTCIETWTSEASIIKLRSTNIPPGEAYDTGWCYYSKPFSISLSLEADGAPIGDPPVKVDADPVDEEDPEEPEIPEPGSPGGPGGPPSGGGGVVTAPLPEPPPTPDQPRPGTGDPNDEARHKELKGAVDRVTSAVTNGANQAKGDAAQTKSLLGGIKDAISGLGEGGGDGEGGIGPGTGTINRPGEWGTTETPEAPGEIGEAMTKLQGVRASAAGLLAGVQGLGAALGLNQQYGTPQMGFAFDCGPFGTHTLNLSSALGDYASLIRQFLLFVLCWMFLFKAVGEIKDSFN